MPHTKCTAASITWTNLHYHILRKWLCGRGYLLEHVLVCRCRVSDLGMLERYPSYQSAPEDLVSPVRKF